MGFVHGKTSTLVVNAVTITGEINGFAFSSSVDTAETTVLGLDSKTYISGLKDSTFSIEGLFEGTAAHIDATLYAMLGGAAVAFTINYDPSDVNITYTGNCLITSYEVDSPVDDVVTVSAEFQCTGDVTRTDV